MLVEVFGVLAKLEAQDDPYQWPVMAGWELYSVVMANLKPDKVSLCSCCNRAVSYLDLNGKPVNRLCKHKAAHDNKTDTFKATSKEIRVKDGQLYKEGHWFCPYCPLIHET